jgi:hypothetical protein
MSSATHTRLYLSAAAVSVAVAAAIWLGGCGGGSTAGYNIPGPEDHYYLTVVLKVSDEAGNALGNGVVWVEDEAETQRTSSHWVALGEGYPDGWTGREVNWISPIYDVILHGPTDSKRVHVRVTRANYGPEDTYFDINRSSPNRVFGYDTLTMYYGIGTAAAPAASAAQHHPQMAAGPALPPGAVTKPLPTH